MNNKRGLPLGEQYLDDTGTPYVSYKLDDNGNLIEGVRTDGDVDIMVELTPFEHGVLVKMAESLGVTTDALIMQVLEAEMEKSEPFGDYQITA